MFLGKPNKDISRFIKSEQLGSRVLGNVRFNDQLFEVAIDKLNLLEDGKYTLAYVGNDNFMLTSFTELSTFTKDESTPEVVYNKFNKYNIAAYACKSIGVFDAGGTMVGHIPLDGFKPSFSQRRYRFGLLSDIHQKDSETVGTESYADFKSALDVFEQKENVDFICTCGDLTIDGCLTSLDKQLKKYAEHVETHSPNTAIYSTTGNHDASNAEYGIEQESGGIRGVDNWKKYVNCRDIETSTHKLTYAPASEQSHGKDHDSISYYFTHQLQSGKRDYFIFLSMRKYVFKSDTNNTYYVEDAGGKDLAEGKSTWIRDMLELAKSENARAFVFTHMFFKDKAGNFAEAYPNGNWLTGKQYDYLNALFNIYKNVVWFSGHSHWKWYLQGADVTQKNNKFLYCNVFHDEENCPNSGYAVHVPSCANPIDSHWDEVNKKWTRDNSTSANKASEGAVVDVYDDCIDIRGISFKCYWDSVRKDEKHMLHYQPIGTYRIYTNR